MRTNGASYSLEREDVDDSGKKIKCYSLVNDHYDHYAKQGKFVAEVLVIARALD